MEDAPTAYVRGRSQQEIKARFDRRYRLRRMVLRIIDAVLGLCVGDSAPQIPGNPRRILLANAGHLGDAVMTTSLLPVLKHAYPDVEIGVLVGKWSIPVFARHPLVDRVHCINHWWLDRCTGSRGGKLWKYLRQWRTTARELRDCRYDIAVETRVTLPNWIPLIWCARVPVRIGSTFGGFSALLTHPVPYEYSGRNRLYEQSGLLRVLDLPCESFDRLAPALAASTADENEEVIQIIRDAGLPNCSYRIIHMGAGVPARGWTRAEWRTLARMLTRNGKTILFTGRGERDRDEVARVIENLPRCLNACDRLTWGGFVAAVRRAELVYCVDTVAGHVASAVGTPCVTIFGGMFEGDHFGPWGLRKLVITNPVECAPCFKANGCKEMNCLRGLSAVRVYEAGQILMKEHDVHL